jgi:outer membrane protein OmpA-like peptidoglycan-associated protein
MTVYTRVHMLSGIALLASLVGCATPPPPPAPPPPPPPAVAAYSGPSLAIEQTDRGVQIFLPSTVLFDAGKADFKQADAAPYLDRLAKLLTEKTKNKVAVEGHTDNVGNAAGNQKLSEQRAEVIRAALVQRGVPAERLSSVGYSFNRPLASNATDQGKATNRRVELVILDEKVGNITQGEPAASFESAFDKLKKMVEDGLIKPMVAGAK